MLLYAVVVIAALVLIGRWRRFTSVQWIWAVFGICIVMVVLWAILIIFVIGPEMQRQAPNLGR